MQYVPPLLVKITRLCSRHAGPIHPGRGASWRNERYLPPLHVAPAAAPSVPPGPPPSFLLKHESPKKRLEVIGSSLLKSTDCVFLRLIIPLFLTFPQKCWVIVWHPINGMFIRVCDVYSLLTPRILVAWTGLIACHPYISHKERRRRGV